MGMVKAVISLDALKHNLARVKELAPQTKVLCVIKANAYGHGVFPVAEALQEADAFAVARLDEACALRRHLQTRAISKVIVILEGVCSAADYQRCSELQLLPVVHSSAQFAALMQALENGFQGDYWLKTDTGMHRLGLSESELRSVIQQLHQDNIQCLPGAIISHFCCADETANSFNQIQLNAFSQHCEHLTILDDSPGTSAEIEKSMANSAAILSLPDSHYDWVRPGIMLYGVSPFETENEFRCGLDEQLKPVMTLSSSIIAIKQLQQGDCIGYGASWCCPEAMPVGVIAIGYGDGYPRHAPPGTPVLINGIEVPLVGRVSMDMISVDLRPLAKQAIAVQAGDTAILWGEGLPIEKVSRQADTIAYELLCQITQRVSFNYE